MALQLRLNGELTGPGENSCPRRAFCRGSRPPSSGRTFPAARGGRDRKRYFLRSLACKRRISSRRRAASSGAGR